VYIGTPIVPKLDEPHFGSPVAFSCLQKLFIQLRMKFWQYMLEEGIIKQNERSKNDLHI